MSEKSNKVPQYVAALAATLGAFALGAVLGWGSPTEGQIHLQLNMYSQNMTEYQLMDKDFVDNLKDPSLAEVGWVGSTMTLGAASVMLPLPFVLDRLGRKMVMLILVVPFTLGWIIICGATMLHDASLAIPIYCVGRYITGFCSGAFCVAAPVFIGEIAEGEIRGTLGVFFQLMLVVGIFYVYVLGKTSVLAISVACGIVPVLFGIIFFFIPESPYYLMMRNKPEAASKSLQWFRGKNFDISAELEVIKETTVAEAEARKGSLKEKLMKKAAKKSLMIGVGLMLCQQLCGINAVIFHASAIFRGSSKDADEAFLSPYTSQLLLGTMQILSTGAAAIIVKKLGSKLLLIISMGLMCVCHVAMGVYFFFADKDPESVASLSWLPVCILCLFILAFSFGAGPIPWAMLGELFPSEIKGVCASLCSCVNWLLAFLVSFTFHFIVDGIGKGAPFMIFAVLCGLGLLFVVFFCIETKGKTLAEIQLFLEGSGGSKGEKGEKGETVEKTAAET